MKMMSKIALVALLATFVVSTPNSWGQAGGGGGGGAGGGAGGTGGGTGGAGGGAGVGGQVGTGQVGAGQAGAGQAGAGQAGAGQAGAGQAGAGQAGAGQAGAGQAGAGNLGTIGGRGVQAGGNQVNRWNNWNGIDQNPWFSNPSVRQQLQLNEQQFGQLQDLYGRSYQRYNSELNNLPPNLNAEEQLRRRADLARRFNQDLTGSMNDLFTDPSLRQRFDQLGLQYRGLTAFQDPSVQQRLNLTNEQQQRISQLQEQWRRQMQEFGSSRTRLQDDNTRQTRTDRPNEDWVQFNRRMQEQLEQVLNPEQRNAWQELTGNRFEFPDSAYFGDNDGEQAERSSPGGRPRSANRNSNRNNR